MGDSPTLRATIIVVSETASKDPSTDKCIPSLREVFTEEGGGRFETNDTVIVSDDVLQIQRAITQRTDGDDYMNLIVTSGGTGFTQKDVTPEVCLRAVLVSPPPSGAFSIAADDRLGPLYFNWTFVRDVGDIL